MAIVQTLYIGLVDAANRPQFKVNPTIAVGDFKVSTDGGALANLTNLPAVTPAGSRLLKIEIEDTEVGDSIVIQGVDAAGSEWDEVIIHIDTTAAIGSVTVDDIWDEVLEGTTTARQSMRIQNAAMGGKASGLATATAIYRDLADSLDRITATVDADGNRTAITYDLT